jgi:hypothetical protein
VVNDIALNKKQLAALFMLLVFLFIHGLKLFHTHDQEYSQDHKFQKEQVSKVNHCDVCDYHFAKDTLTQNSPIVFSEAQGLPDYFNFYQSRSIRSIGLGYSDRGPPSLI